ncbi:MAG TPA: hypothetical protein VNY07_08120 [Chthoniobacterales bacterium]|jgi:hypothetical protein|nr:hypothetical protein [Chthoniobacterales bacterium]
MAKKRGEKTVVRGADGALYVLSKTGPLVKLADDQAQELTAAIKKAEEKLEGIIAEELSCVAASCTQSVHIHIPDVLIG